MRRILTIASMLALTGCAGLTANREVRDLIGDDTQVNAAQKRLDNQRDRARPSPVVEDVAMPFIGNKKVALTKSATWPRPLRKDGNVTMSFSDGRPDGFGGVVMPIGQFAQKVSLATGVPVRVNPDALTDAAGNPVEVTLPQNFQGSLTPVFDTLLGKSRVFTAYNDGTLEFYRTVTRQFLIAAPAGETDSATVSASGGNEGGFNASVSTTTKVAYKSSAGIVASVKLFLSKGVEPILNEGSGSLTITDTPDVIDKVAVFIERENRLMTRQMVFDVKVVRFTDNNDGQSGLDWNLVYNQISAAAGGALSIASPASGIATGVAGLGFTATPNLDGRASRFDGSSLFLKALNVQGKTVIVRQTTLSTLNRKPVMQAYNKTIDYVNETTASATQAGVATGQKTKTENAGRVVFITPSIVSDSMATIDFSVKEAVLNPFKTNTIGSGQSQQSVMLLDKDTDLLKETITLTDGGFHVAAINEATLTAAERSLDKNVSGLFGGLVQGTKANQQYFLLVTMRFAN